MDTQSCMHLVLVGFWCLHQAYSQLSPGWDIQSQGHILVEEDRATDLLTAVVYVRWNLEADTKTNKGSVNRPLVLRGIQLDKRDTSLGDGQQMNIINAEPMTNHVGPRIMCGGPAWPDVFVRPFIHVTLLAPDTNEHVSRRGWIAQVNVKYFLLWCWQRVLRLFHH